MSSASPYHRARQDRGEPAGAGDHVNATLADLENRSTPELRAEWRSLYRTEPPTRLSRDLLLRGIAFRWQERLHGSLSTATKRRLDALARNSMGKMLRPSLPPPSSNRGRGWFANGTAALMP